MMSLSSSTDTSSQIKKFSHVQQKPEPFSQSHHRSKVLVLRKGAWCHAQGLMALREKARMPRSEERG
jgi:hypothetical protein